MKSADILSDHLFQSQLKKLDNEEALGRFFLRALSDFVWEKYDDFLIGETPRLIEIEKELRNYCISSIKYNKDHNVVIKLSRPGLIIGMRGANIHAIQDFMKKRAEKYGIPFGCIRLEEDTTPLEDDLLYSIYTYKIGTTGEEWDV
jgi:hypothetical protein